MGVGMEGRKDIKGIRKQKVRPGFSYFVLLILVVKRYRDTAIETEMGRKGH